MKAIQTETGLHLEPETEREAECLQKLIRAERLWVSGCGYDPETRLVIHCQIDADD